jgi:hypothetical protein
MQTFAFSRLCIFMSIKYLEGPHTVIFSNKVLISSIMKIMFWGYVCLTAKEGKPSVFFLPHSPNSY